MPEPTRLEPVHQADGPLAGGLLDGLLSDVLPEPVVPPAWPGATPSVDEAAAERDVARGLADHRGHRQAWYGDLVGPLLVPALSAGLLHPGLTKADVDLPVVLAAPRDRVGEPLDEAMRAARAQLLDDDRVLLEGVELPLAGPDPASAARAGLDALDSSSPAWFRLPADPLWLPALAVVAEDGAEHLTLEIDSPDAGFDGLATVLHALVASGMRFSIGGWVRGPELVTTSSAHGLLNLLVAMDRAIDGAPVGTLGTVLARTDVAALIADAVGIEAVSAVRDRLARIACAPVRALIEDLEATGLIEPDVA